MNRDETTSMAHDERRIVACVNACAEYLATAIRAMNEKGTA